MITLLNPIKRTYFEHDIYIYIHIHLLWEICAPNSTTSKPFFKAPTVGSLGQLRVWEPQSGFEGVDPMFPRWLNHLIEIYYPKNPCDVMGCKVATCFFFGPFRGVSILKREGRWCFHSFGGDGFLG